MARVPGPLASILSGLDDLNTWAGELTGLAFADERGWLSDSEQARFRELEQEYPRVQADLAARWRELPADVVAGHDACVTRVLARLEAAGGVLDNFYLSDLGSRAAATVSPARNFDSWAIWAVHRIDASACGQ